MKRYRNIVERGLIISDDFFRTYQNTIAKRLCSAAEQISGEGDFVKSADLFGVNQCVHLATSIVLLGSHKDNVSALKEQLVSDNNYGGIDPTTVMTISTLLYVIDWVKENIEKLSLTDEVTNDEEVIRKEVIEDSVAKIETRFNKVNWLIGQEPLERLQEEI
jgi:hypothetical protein